MYIVLAKPARSGQNSTMEQTTTSDAGWRGSPDLWLQAAYDALIENGVDAVRILPLAKTLDISRTSFYWFFKDREELLDALIGRWREKTQALCCARLTPMQKPLKKPF